MTRIFTAATILAGVATFFSQVGVNTVSPSTTMDVRAKRDSGGNITDNKASGSTAQTGLSFPITLESTPNVVVSGLTAGTTTTATAGGTSITALGYSIATITAASASSVRHLALLINVIVGKQHCSFIAITPPLVRKQSLNVPVSHLYSQIKRLNSSHCITHILQEYKSPKNSEAQGL